MRRRGTITVLEILLQIRHFPLKCFEIRKFFRIHNHGEIHSASFQKGTKN